MQKTKKTKKTIFVTGASSGIGKVIAIQLLSEGHTVYVAARRIERMQDIEKLGAIPIQMDISKEGDIVAAVDTVKANNDNIDVLINNAGFATYGAMEDTSIEDARYQFEVNLFGLARLTQLLIPSMRDQGSGKIINISSIGGKIYSPLGAWYHATKHALEGWSDCLRLELKQFGIHVVIVEPGAIVTDFADVMTGPMLKRSGNTPYASLANRVAEMTKKEYDNKMGSPPSVIAKVVSKAIKSPRPKTRYAAGKYSFMTLFLRRWLSDRMFDRVIMSLV